MAPELLTSYTSCSINQEYAGGSPATTSATVLEGSRKLEIIAFGWGKAPYDITDRSKGLVSLELGYCYQM